MKTSVLKKDQIKKNWWLIDLGKTTLPLGRIATQVANLIRGKNKPNFSPTLNCGDYVVIINSTSMRVTGNKLEQKKYYRHSGYFGGLKERTFKEQFDLDPNFIFREAVKGMLTRNTIRRYLMRNLFVYEGDEHPHLAQQPTHMEI